jgi:hypothetical protein
VPETRPEDGHDVLAAYLQLAELDSKSAAIDTNTFIAEIKERHRKLLQDRPSANPGLFKQQQNQAGDTVFTRPEMVEGTLLEGLRIFKSLKSPFSRAMFVHFMLSDVHPFTDGNGRLSRIMTRKELASAGLSRIVVPTVIRNDYIDGSIDDAEPGVDDREPQRGDGSNGLLGSPQQRERANLQASGLLTRLRLSVRAHRSQPSPPEAAVRNSRVQLVYAVSRALQTVGT